ncbi:minor tail protein [Microbacterium phage Mercedes]|nr:minor tail protein [Microbacterium phage Mercedes]
MTINDLRDITSFKWATVTASYPDPLAIKLDGDTAALALIPDSIVDPRDLYVGDRVRVELSLRKVVVHGKANSALRGTTAQRDARFASPATDAARVALANRQVQWFNTVKGYTESYFAPATLAGMAVPGLAAGHAAGWYPVAGSHLTATRVKNNGFQSVAGGALVAPTLTVTLTNRGGFGTPGTSDIVPPVGGYYDVIGGVYWSGGGAMGYRTTIVRFGGGGVDITSARMYGSGSDGQLIAPADSVLLLPSQSVELVSQTAAADNMYGDGNTRRTFISLTYAGPPLA